MGTPNEEIIVNNETPVIETPVVVLEEKRYEYQPTDADGRPIGNKQVLKYTTQDELVAKLQEQSILQIRKLRELTKKNRLGIVDSEEIDPTAPRFQAPTQFAPGQLSREDRYKLAQDILDPETFDTAITTVFETVSGFKANELRSTLTELQQDNSNLKAQIEADKFLARNPEYVVVEDNQTAITNWMMRHNLAPVAANFQKAYDTLSAAGVLITSLEVIPDPVYTPPVAFTPDPVIVPNEAPIEEEIHIREELPQENILPLEPIAPVQTPETPVAAKPVVARVPTGLNKGNSGSGGQSPVNPVDTIVYEYVQRDGNGRQIGEKKVYTGLRAIDAMPSEEYKRRLFQEKGFAAKVKALQDAADKRAFDKRQGR
jgi:hypothetical protein